MAIPLGYNNTDGDFINIEAYIIHPDHLQETWIVFRHAFREEGEEPMPAEKIDFKHLLEDILNGRLPGLRIETIHSYYVDDYHNYEISFEYQRQEMNPELIHIHQANCQILANEDKRMNYIHKITEKLDQ